MQRTFLHTNESPLSHSKTVKSSKKYQTDWLSCHCYPYPNPPALHFKEKKSFSTGEIPQPVNKPGNYLPPVPSYSSSAAAWHGIVISLYSFLYSDDHQPIFAQEFIKNYLLLASLFVKTLVIKCVIIPPAF